ncbi:hypothetical protein K466DRAFT_238194 [Polyporus arcularius HHB13444]|uniref:Uncharacterized protein n=1 Tax=Polyporus arcularius HHB13444 TaxID=1314778 RepID=A0A5C3P316_9APHY|nr:hypothetical protein K466DRAFT_238194 [Polyporus arcularius HHB13444]
MRIFFPSLMFSSRCWIASRHASLARARASSIFKCWYQTTGSILTADLEARTERREGKYPCPCRCSCHREIVCPSWRSRRIHRTSPHASWRWRGGASPRPACRATRTSVLAEWSESVGSLRYPRIVTTTLSEATSGLFLRAAREYKQRAGGIAQ